MKDLIIYVPFILVGFLIALSATSFKGGEGQK